MVLFTFFQKLGARIRRGGFFDTVKKDKETQLIGFGIETSPGETEDLFVSINQTPKYEIADVTHARGSQETLDTKISKVGDPEEDEDAANKKFVTDQFTDGVSGWFDDGANFRITVTSGLVTTIADSTAGGHS